MIAFIQQEIISRNWLTPAEFSQVVTISQMTPGPVAVNAATFVGARTSSKNKACASCQPCRLSAALCSHRPSAGADGFPSVAAWQEHRG